MESKKLSNWSLIIAGVIVALSIFVGTIYERSGSGEWMSSSWFIIGFLLMIILASLIAVIVLGIVSIVEGNKERNGSAKIKGIIAIVLGLLSILVLFISMNQS